MVRSKIAEMVSDKRWAMVRSIIEIIEENTQENKEQISPAHLQDARPPRKKSGRQSTPKHPLPEHFVVTPAMRTWATEHAPGVDLDHETAKLVAWAGAKGEWRSDWTATWRLWMLNAVQHGSRGQRRAASPPERARRHPHVARPEDGEHRSVVVNQHDFKALASLMALLAETFDKDFTVQRVEIYARALAEYPIEVIAAAVDDAIRRLKFFPKPAELIELIEGSPDDQAEHGWGQIWLALTRSGTYQSLLCEDDVLAETVRRLYGSWADAWNILRPEADPPGHQIHHRNFVSTYRDIARQRQPFDPYLIGRTEATNLASMSTWTHGVPIEPEVTYLPKVGDPEPRPLRAISPQHPLIALIDRATQPALAAGDSQDDGPSQMDEARPHDPDVDQHSAPWPAGDGGRGSPAQADAGGRSTAEA